MILDLKKPPPPPSRGSSRSDYPNGLKARSPPPQLRHHDTRPLRRFTWISTARSWTRTNDPAGLALDAGLCRATA